MPNAPSTSAKASAPAAHGEAARGWLDNVHAGDDAVQLTPRAVVSGMLIGGVMPISNFCVGLKTGWGLGVMITTSIIATRLLGARADRAGRRAQFPDGQPDIPFVHEKHRVLKSNAAGEDGRGDAPPYPGVTAPPAGGSSESPWLVSWGFRRPEDGPAPPTVTAHP